MKEWWIFYFFLETFLRTSLPRFVLGMLLEPSYEYFILRTIRSVPQFAKHPTCSSHAGMYPKLMIFFRYQQMQKWRYPYLTVSSESYVQFEKSRVTLVAYFATTLPSLPRPTRQKRICQKKNFWWKKVYRFFHRKFSRRSSDQENFQVLLLMNFWRHMILSNRTIKHLFRNRAQYRLAPYISSMHLNTLCRNVEAVALHDTAEEDIVTYITCLLEFYTRIKTRKQSPTAYAYITRAILHDTK